MPHPQLGRLKILHGYAAEPDLYDEMWRGDGQIEPYWQPFIQAFETLGPAELERWQQEARRLLWENGVTYNVHGDQESHSRVWALDIIPFIISHQDWQVIEAGIKQRAELLNLLLIDIYGPRRLIRDGLLPMEVIYSHSGFLRQCDGIHQPGEQQLITYAADLARGPDRQMWVLGDRTQAPSGAGYALENRTVIARVLSQMFKEHKIHRLSNFFRELQGAFADLGPSRVDPPRVVVLTPGPHNETYFEHAYLASYLGYSLVQGDDLTMRDGRIWLKALTGLQPVDVILRRVDDLYCDPLELRADSWLGVAGLLEAARRQHVAIANPLGSSVLENPALMPFLPGLARHLLGEDLILPSAATWWCGQPKERAYVLANLDKLVIKRVARLPQAHSIFANQLSRSELTMLRAQIEAHPYHFVGQEQVGFSTTPSLIGRHIEARHVVLRSFVIARNGDYTVMPGGLARVAPNKGELIVSNQAGGISKDTWVLTPEPPKHLSLWLQSNQLERALKSSYHLPSRAAENLFWVGRYAERTEATARILRMIFQYFSDAESFGDDVEADSLPILLGALTQVTMTYPGFVGDGKRKRFNKPVPELLAVTFDQARVGSLRFNVKAMVGAAYAVRNLWSTDTWRVINELDSLWSQPATTGRLNPTILQPKLNQLITFLMAFAGLSTESVTHEAGWLLLEIGRRLERSLLTIALIRSTLVYQHDGPVESLLLENLLRISENIITYRRRYRSYLEVETVLDLLLLDQTNPRSVLYQFDHLQEYITRLPREQTGYQLSAEERLLLDITSRLRLSDTEQLARPDQDTHLRRSLDEFLAHLATTLSALSDVITQTYFIHAQVPRRLLTPTLPDSTADSSTDSRTVA